MIFARKSVTLLTSGNVAGEVSAPAGGFEVAVVSSSQRVYHDLAFAIPDA